MTLATIYLLVSRTVHLQTGTLTRDGGMLARGHTVSSQVVKLGRCPKSPLSHSTFPNTPNFGIYTTEFSRLFLSKGIPRRGAIILCQNLCPNFGFKRKRM